jgi:hypothetical protein
LIQVELTLKFGLGIGATASATAYYLFIQKRQIGWMLDTMAQVDLLDLVPKSAEKEIDDIKPRVLSGKEYRHEYDTPIPFQVNPILGVVTIPKGEDGVERTRFVHYAETYPTLDNLHPTLELGENVVPVEAIKDDINFLGAVVERSVRREEYEIGLMRKRANGTIKNLWVRGLDRMIRGLEGMKSVSF